MDPALLPIPDSKSTQVPNPTIKTPPNVFNTSQTVFILTPIIPIIPVTPTFDTTTHSLVNASMYGYTSIPSNKIVCMSPRNGYVSQTDNMRQLPQGIHNSETQPEHDPMCLIHSVEAKDKFDSTLICQQSVSSINQELVSNKINVNVDGFVYFNISTNDIRFVPDSLVIGDSYYSSGLNLFGSRHPVFNIHTMCLYDKVFVTNEGQCQETTDHFLICNNIATRIVSTVDGDRLWATCHFIVDLNNDIHQNYPGFDLIFFEQFAQSDKKLNSDIEDYAEQVIEADAIAAGGEQLAKHLDAYHTAIEQE